MTIYTYIYIYILRSYLDIFLSFACLFDFRVDPTGNAWNSSTVQCHLCFPWLLMRAGTGLVVGVKLGSCNSNPAESRTILRYTPEIQHGTWKWWFSNRNLLFQGSIFRFHVCFGGCILRMGLEPNTTLGKGERILRVKVISQPGKNHLGISGDINPGSHTQWIILLF